jgi:hypothetical protein
MLWAVNRLKMTAHAKVNYFLKVGGSKILSPIPLVVAFKFMISVEGSGIS